MTDPGPFAALELDGKVVVVTGAANGIGATTAGVLTERGATVERLDRTGGPAIVECDVTDEARIADVVAEVALRHGRIDALVNVAGIGLIKSLAETTPEAWRRVVEVNLTGPFLMARATIDHLIESGGSIVNVASVSGIHAQPLISAYGASKGGLVQLTRILAVEFAQAGVRVNAVCPGGVDTQLTAGVRDDLRRVADRVAPAAMHRFHPPRSGPGRCRRGGRGDRLPHLRCRPLDHRGDDGDRPRDVIVLMFGIRPGRTGGPARRSTTPRRSVTRRGTPPVPVGGKRLFLVERVGHTLLPSSTVPPR